MTCGRTERANAAQVGTARVRAGSRMRMPARTPSDERRILHQLVPNSLRCHRREPLLKSSHSVCGLVYTTARTTKRVCVCTADVISWSSAREAPRSCRRPSPTSVHAATQTPSPNPPARKVQLPLSAPTPQSNTSKCRSMSNTPKGRSAAHLSLLH
eukprot:3334445-Pleurochrysis_carterae.AAC.1